MTDPRLEDDDFKQVLIWEYWDFDDEDEEEIEEEEVDIDDEESI
ncbi:hypothetical protein EVB99_083 [Rhizobium phage RHph_N3_19]|nr:hypothetical protein EVB99_083 [Rhizobium phage RHph_N3_19]